MKTQDRTGTETVCGQKSLFYELQTIGGSRTKLRRLVVKDISFHFRKRGGENVIFELSFLIITKIVK